MSKKNKSKFILVFSDTHVGSDIAIWPKGFVSQSGHDLPQSKFQEWLNECWDHMLSWVHNMVGDDDLTAVFNGDIIEGTHHRTTEIMSAKPEDQFDAAVQIFESIAQIADRLYMIEGTECHVGRMEAAVGARFGAVVNPVTQQAAFPRLVLDVDGCICSFAHHIGTTSRPYLEASQHSINHGVEVIEAARNGHAIPNVMCRAHRHRHGIWRDGNLMSIVTGAWQGITRFGSKVVPAAVPNPSVVLLEFVEGTLLPIPHELVFVPKQSPIHKI